MPDRPICEDRAVVTVDQSERPLSRCPSCGSPFRLSDSVAAAARVSLARCHACRSRISGRYPLLEIATVLLLAAVVAVKGPDEDALLGVAFVLLLVPVTLIDIGHRIIPNKLMLLGAAVALALVLITRSDRLDEHLIAAAAAGGFLLVAALAYPAGMGMGDVKLAGVMGLFLGRAVAPAMFVALLAGSLVSMGIVARKGRAGRKSTLPFGPYLALGGLVGLLVGDEAMDWYTDNL